MSSIAFTVIVPVHNSSHTIEQLLNSIPLRPDLELIVVDDYSTEIEFEKTHAWVMDEKYHSIQKKMLKNEGVNSAGAARNLGLAHARGQWIIFADSDDYFTPDLNIMLDRYQSSPCDIVFFKPTSFSLSQKNKGDRHQRYAQLVQEYINRPTQIRKMKMGYRFYVPWSKLIRRELINKHDIRFDEIIVSNDVMFSVKTFHFSQMVKADIANIYCVTQTAGSLTTQKNQLKSEIRVDVFIKMHIWLKENCNKKIYRAIRRPQISLLWGHVQNYGFKFAYRMSRKMSKANIGLVYFSTFTEVLKRFFYDEQQ